ncbi:hypothetical protein LMG3431_02343 [Achromobacter pestifer]|uniref:Uncharacterized protein n=1 Tax=Achromobacter pestifer TaxID=1353889 RepID=A0A6S6YUF5_9BURK|nr:hypothetical protein LMG3431_02343 [Achromobacter pestifer]
MLIMPGVIPRPAVVVDMPCSKAPFVACASVVVPMSTKALLTLTAKPVVAATPAVWVWLKSTLTSAFMSTTGAMTLAPSTVAVVVSRAMFSAIPTPIAAPITPTATLTWVRSISAVTLVSALISTLPSDPTLPGPEILALTLLRVLLVTRTPAPDAAMPPPTATDAVTASRPLKLVCSSASTDTASFAPMSLPLTVLMYALTVLAASLSTKVTASARLKPNEPGTGNEAETATP